MGHFFVDARLAGGAPDTGRARVALGALGADGSRPGTVSPLRCAVLASRGGGHAADGDLHLLFDGRLDNRDELVRALELEPASDLGDAAIALRAYRRWREGCFERFLGPFGVVVIEAEGRRVVAARDVVGCRRLVFAEDGAALLLADAERALLADGRLNRSLDATSVARYFAYRGPRAGDTFFTAIRELPPGGLLTAEEGSVQVRTFDAVRVERRRRGADGELEEEFREVLGCAVACRLGPATAGAGILMSGGLDSTSVAAVAARESAAGRPPLISWLFDRVSAADERDEIVATARRCGVELFTVPVEDERLLPAAGAAAHPADFPGGDLYRPLLVAAFREARRQRLERLLTGHHANQLWMGGEYWLRDLVAAGRLWTAAAGLMRMTTGAAGTPRTTLRTLTSSIARLVGWNGGKRESPPWLTRRAVRCGAVEADLEGRSLTGRGEVDRWGPLAPYWTLEAHRLRLLALDSGVQVCLPYRDRRVIELALSLPAHQGYRPGESKRLQRRAMEDLLPESVRRRQRPADLFAWVVAALEKEGIGKLLRRLDDCAEAWAPWVSSEWLRERLSTVPPDAPATGIAWRCLTFAEWSKAWATC